MIIFGWGNQVVKNYGPVERHHCEHCNNDEFWTLHKISTWFTLFFIPIFPYSNKRLLICPICRYGIELDSKKFKELLLIAENNKAMIRGEIDEQEYNKRMNQLKIAK